MTIPVPPQRTNKLIDSRLARKAKLEKEREAALKQKTFSLVYDRCKKCGGMVLMVQKGAGKNRFVVLDARPISAGARVGNQGIRRKHVYRKHRCRNTSPVIRKKSGSY